MERLIRFKNYRNIGINGQEDLILNTTLELGKMGSVITLIGENNLGKSNTIQGILKYSKNSLNKIDDMYDNDFDNELVPEISLIVKDDNYSLTHKVILDLKDGTNYSVFECSEEKNDSETIYKILLDIQKNLSCIQNNVFNELVKSINIFNTQLKEIKNSSYLKTFVLNRGNDFFENFKHILTYCSNKSPELYQYIMENKKYDLISEYFNYYCSNYPKNLLNDFKEKYNLEFEPKVYEYKNDYKKIDDNLLKSSFDFLNDSIIGIVLNYIHIEKSQVQKAYNLYKQSGSNAPLNNLKNFINKKMSIINDKFNSIFKSINSKYSFEFKFEHDGIYLNVNFGSKQLIAKRNSEGFSWFFNFFFNFILKYDPKPGDIVLLDDQAYGLMPMGINELHKYLQEFALKNDVTFVIATANEHFIDIKYLEEIRVVNRIDVDKAEIINRVSLFNDGDVDTLKFLKRSIMVIGNIFDNDDVQMTYVEDITDYNYLTAFAIKLECKNITFVPFNGFKRENITKKLKRKHHTNVFLVNGDKTGLDFKKRYENENDTVILSLSEVDPKFIYIENLFNLDEINKFKLKSKSYNDSCNFKKNIDFYWNDISKETKENFKKVLDYIIE